MIFGASAAVAQQDQTQPNAPNSTSSLRLPQNPQLFGNAMPSVVKATAIVNGDVITQTDVDQRLALLAIANGNQIPADHQLERIPHFELVELGERDLPCGLHGLAS